jgi:hypothetical protein
MVFNPRAIVYHRHPESWRRYAQRKYKIGYWKTLVLRLHPTKAWSDSHTPWDLKVQMLLVALSTPLTLLCLLGRWYLGLLACTLGAFVVSALPFAAKAWRRDRPVAVLSLPVLYLRAWALGLGLVAGFVSALFRRGPLAATPRAEQ